MPPPAQVSLYTNPVSSMMQSHDGVEEDLDVNLDAEDLVPLKEIVSNFLGVPLERLHPHTSLISLGLDSIRSVGLSRILRQHGYSTNAADIMGDPILRKLGVLHARSPGRSVQAEIDQGVLSLQKQRERTQASFDPSTCKLSIDDEVEIFPTTVLQTGMLSQVPVFLTCFLPVTPHSQNRLKDSCLSWKPVFPLIRPPARPRYKPSTPPKRMESCGPRSRYSSNYIPLRGRACILGTSSAFHRKVRLAGM